MAALDEYDARPELQDPARGLVHALYRIDADAREDCRFGDVWRHDVGAWQELGTHRKYRILYQQSIAPLGDHHGIDDEERQVHAHDRRGHGLDDRGVREHAGLDRVGADVAGDRLDLRAHEISGQRQPARDAERVLGG